MKFPTTLAAFLSTSLYALLVATPACAGEVQDLFLKKSGEIYITTSSYGDMIIIPSLIDSSKGTWRGLSITQPFEEAEGAEVEGKAKLKAEDGQEVDLQVSAKAEKNIVTTGASWKETSPVKGSGRLDLLIGREVLENLTGSSDGTEMSWDDGKLPPEIVVHNELLFHRKADGKPAMRLSFPEMPCRVSFVSTRRNGDKAPAVILRISPRIERGAESQLGDPSECKWQLIFEE